MDLEDPARAVMAPAMSAVLRALVEAPDAKFTMRQLAGVAGISHNSAQSVIHRLAEHGLVLTTPVGRAVLCRFNRAHLAADSVANLVTLRARLLTLLRDDVSAWPTPPLHASLFGSGARGDGNVDSDLDVLVVRPDLGTVGDEEAWEDQLAASSSRLRLMTGNPVNYLDTTRSGLADAVRSGERIIDRWQRDAVHLYGPPLTSSRTTAVV